MAPQPTHGRIAGPIVMIGFGPVGQGLWHLISHHVEVDRSAVVVIEPDPAHHAQVRAEGLSIDDTMLTQANCRDVLGAHLQAGTGFCVNVAVDTASLDLICVCRELGVPYIDATVAVWKDSLGESDNNAARSTYMWRQALRDEKARMPGGATAISACGANPGLVSWLTKEALLILARDSGRADEVPQTREGWADLMRTLGVTGLHLTECDSQARAAPRPPGVFVNTWSVAGFLDEGFRPVELGWGTHETWFPENGYRHGAGCGAAIWLDRPAAATRVHSWSPARGPLLAYPVPRNGAISLADYFTIGDPALPSYRPTCHTAYHPCDEAMLSLQDRLGTGARQEAAHILRADEIVAGGCEVGVLLFGHARNALWVGVEVSAEAAKAHLPDQNAAILPTCGAVLAGMLWAAENPGAGIVEAEEMDHRRCLDLLAPYLGPVASQYTDWTPLENRWRHYPEDIDDSDPWVFRNVLAS